MIIENDSTSEQIVVYSEKSNHVSQGLMIYSIYGHGGNTGAVYNRDYVVLWNGSNSPIDLSTYTIQYAGATGTSWGRFILSETIPSKGFILLKLATGTSGGVDLPSYPLSLTNASPNIAGSAGKLALMSTTNLITSGISNPIGHVTFGQYVVDFVGFGTANAFENQVAPSLNNASIRRVKLLDTNNNFADFQQATASEGLDILFP
ncbi:MAG: hypothetical protein CVV57_04000 [Tenericutes bacterium HGW-Tenericutes-2]|jgi:hypothetical protein|nr:MAG: hypothetical protein CVV57_04000 [Tenericutes bacterium HGW-Tenericutes-2]